MAKGIHYVRGILANRITGFNTKRYYGFMRSYKDIHANEWEVIIDFAKAAEFEDDFYYVTHKFIHTGYVDQELAEFIHSALPCRFTDHDNDYYQELTKVSPRNESRVMGHTDNVVHVQFG